MNHLEDTVRYLFLTATSQHLWQTEYQLILDTRPLGTNDWIQLPLLNSDVTKRTLTAMTL